MPNEKRVDGMAGVVVAETRLSLVDGEQGRLLFCGEPLEALSGRVSFEAVCGLLWDGELPAPAREAELQSAIAAGRAAAFERLPALSAALEHADGMEALRACVSALPAREFETAPQLTGAVGVFAAAWQRTRTGTDWVPPQLDAPHAEDYLHMATGDGKLGAGAEAYLVTVAEHGMNASTFTARVIASTGSDSVSAVAGAVGALKGPLHGGAPGPVLDMLDAVGTPENARSWLEAQLAAGQRIMGMGHRVYRVRDPRAAALEAALAKLGSDAGPRLTLARRVEREAEALLRERHPDRPLRANVEFYTALLLEALDLDRAAFSPTFAVGRVAGWCAHIAEQRETGRLIRPKARYVGRRVA